MRNRVGRGEKYFFYRQVYILISDLNERTWTICIFCKCDHFFSLFECASNWPCMFVFGRLTSVTTYKHKRFGQCVLAVWLLCAMRVKKLLNKTSFFFLLLFVRFKRNNFYFLHSVLPFFFNSSYSQILQLNQNQAPKTSDTESKFFFFPIL